MRHLLGAFSWLLLVVSPLARFLKVYLVKGGFRDGYRGWVVAWGSAFTVLLKYAKRRERTAEPDPALRRLADPTNDDPEPWSTREPGDADQE